MLVSHNTDNVNSTILYSIGRLGNFSSILVVKLIL